MRLKQYLLFGIFIAFGIIKTYSQCWISVSGGSAFSAGIQSDGTLWTWGESDYGQLGGGFGYPTKLVPTKIGNDSTWMKIVCGSQYSIALKSNGSLWAFGANYNGQLGIINSPIGEFSPKQIGTDLDWVDMAVGEGTTIAKKSDGTLWSWGFAINGTLGDGTIIDRAFPVMLSTEMDWEFFGSGSYHVLALRNQGGLYTWGANLSGQLGDGTNSNKNIPTYIDVKSWYNLTGGKAHSVALVLVGAQESNIYTWGSNQYGQLGHGTTTDLLIPTQLGSNTDWVSIACNYQATYAIKSNGSLWAWGQNNHGQLGDGSNLNRNQPVQVGNDLNWVSVFNVKGDHMLGLKSDGSLWGWGYNVDGQLGDGSTNNSNVPKLIMTCGPAGIENNSLNQFSIFPNPVKDILNIQKQSDLKIDEIYISDVNGKRIGNSYSNLEKINVQHFANGVYVLNILSQNQVSHLKFIKQ